jgi:4-amino-4-deoxy-L-arabinose transferase-like glycosyltransferase
MDSHTKQQDIALLGSVLVLALMLRLWHLSAITDNYDEGVYWASLRALHAGNGLFVPVFSSQPPFFLLALLPLVSLLGSTLLAGRFGIVFFSLLGILAIYVLGRRLGGRWVGFGAALLLAVDHLSLVQAQSIQAEAPAIALMLMAVAAASFADRARLAASWQASLLSGSLTALAILTKLFAVVAVVPIVLLLLGQITGQAGHRAQDSRQVSAPISGRKWGLLVLGCYLLGLVATGLLVLLPYFGRLDALYQQVIAFHLDAARAFPGHLYQNATLILHAQAEYPLIVAALLGAAIGLLRKQSVQSSRWGLVIALSWAIAALVVLLQQAPLFEHHLVLLVPPLALCASLGLAPRPANDQESAASFPGPVYAAPGRISLMGRFLPLLSTRASMGLRSSLPVLLGSVALFALSTDLRFPIGLPAQQAAALTAVANDLQAVTTPDQQVITDDQYLADLAERNVPPELVDTSFVRIATGYLTTAQVIALAAQPQVGAILFYTGRFDQLIGFRAWVQAHFHLSRDYGQGKALYLPGSS